MSVFKIVLEEFWPSLQDRFSSLRFVKGFPAPFFLTSLHRILVRLRLGLSLDHCSNLIHFFYSYSAVDFYLCLGFLPCWCLNWSHTWLFTTQWYFSSWQCNKLGFPWFCRWKETQIINHPPVCLRVRRRVCVGMQFEFFQT